ncbi:MAG TPA: glycosyltransferase [Nitrospirae bacterium]|nr:trehalose synthase [bacterium BMS3Abin06]HDH13134.1 glycosyltransferase [Nitrospirota bacterium]HDZ03310.1 glycosyltransferase [Nitrospirota bacterium]
MIRQYSGIAPKGDLLLIQRLCNRLKGKSFLHVNSTREGGGVAEILHRMIPLLTDLGIDARWEVIEGDAGFYDFTKKMHNALQGKSEKFSKAMWEYYYETNKRNRKNINLNADAVLIHDPQPAPLIDFRRRSRKSIWMWRCHIDISNPMPGVWANLKKYVVKYDTAIFSVAKFAKALPINEFIITPSIDPLSDKNRDLTDKEINDVAVKFDIPRDKPIILQVSRFDKFKDPIGVINAYKIVKKYNDCRLILAGSPATDDPEGEAILNEVKDYAGNDPDIHTLLLPPDNHKEINALQRMADVILQKSIKEGFGLTVSEAMWKEKPVIGGAVGGIPLQIVHGVTGFVVYSVEGAAFRIRQFLNNPEMAVRMGRNGKEYVKNNFLLTRQIRDYLSLWYCSMYKGKNVIEL